MELLCYRISIAWKGLVRSECASAYRNTWIDVWIDLKHLIWSSSTNVEADRFQRGLLTVTGSFRMDASVAAVGLSLSEDLIGLLLRLWAYFSRNPKGSVPTRSLLVYRFNLLLASLGPPASCCGDPGLEAGLLSWFASSRSRSVISISNF